MIQVKLSGRQCALLSLVSERFLSSFSDIYLVPVIQTEPPGTWTWLSKAHFKPAETCRTGFLYSYIDQGRSFFIAPAIVTM